MSELENQFTSVLNTFWTSEVVQTILIWGVIVLAVLWLASAFWTFRDMEERTENVVLPYLASGLVILATPFFFLAAILFYKILRPPERLGDVYERNLSEEALLAEVEEIKTCRTCDRRINPAWIICPWCRSRLNRVCPNCKQIVGLDWTICAWCGVDFERSVVALATKTKPVAEVLTRDWWPEVQVKAGETPPTIPAQNLLPSPVEAGAAKVEVANPLEGAPPDAAATPANVRTSRLKKARSNVPPTQTP
jgi:RNA polymerase subunit RPABC4/transcription elongation factor Spt4